MRIRPGALLALMLAATLVLGACSDDSGDVATDTTETTSAQGSATTDPPADVTTTVAAGDAEPVPSVGCGTSTVGALTKERRTLDVDGVERWYLLTTPGDHDGHTPLPLVIDYHGFLEGAELHGQFSGLAELGAAEGFVVVQPNGTGDLVRWNANAANPDNEDVAYTEQLLDTLGTDLCLDTSRIYATGVSNGAMMTSIIGCQLGDRFAAIAPVSGIMAPDPCDPGRPMPVLAFHGTADPILQFNSGGPAGDGSGSSPDGPPDMPPATGEPDLDGPGYPANVAVWAERNGCGEYTDTNVTERVIHRVYDCPSGAEVEFYILVGGGHDWPGNEATGLEDGPGPDNPVMDIDASELMWAFFQDHTLPA